MARAPFYGPQSLSPRLLNEFDPYEYYGVPLIPASRITLPHFSFSARTKAANSSGVSAAA